MSSHELDNCGRAGFVDHFYELHPGLEAISATHTVCDSRHRDDIKPPSIDEKRKVDATTLLLFQLPRYRDTGTAKPYVNGVERNNAALQNQRSVRM